MATFNINYNNACDIPASNVGNLAKIYLTATTDTTKLFAKRTESNGQYCYEVGTAHDINSSSFSGDTLTKTVTDLNEDTEFNYSAIICYNVDLHERQYFDSSHIPNDGYYYRFFYNTFASAPNSAFQSGNIIITNSSGIIEQSYDNASHDYGKVAKAADDFAGSSSIASKLEFSCILPKYLNKNTPSYFTDSMEDCSVNIYADFKLHIVYENKDDIPKSVIISCGDKTVEVSSDGWGTATGSKPSGSDTSIYDASVLVSRFKLFTSYDLFEDVTPAAANLGNSIYAKAGYYLNDIIDGYINYPNMNCSGLSDGGLASLKVYLSFGSLVPDASVITYVMPTTTSGTYTNAGKCIRYNYGGNNNLFYSDSSYQGYINTLSTSDHVTDIWTPISIAVETNSTTPINTGVHLFNRTFMKKNLITVKIPGGSGGNLNKIKFYIDGVSCSADTAERYTIVGKHIVGGDEGPTGKKALIYAQRYDDGSNISITDASVNISSTLSALYCTDSYGRSGCAGYNSGLIDNVGVINQYVNFTVSAVPSVKPDTATLKIDGYTAKDYNGKVNNVLDSNLKTHTISIDVKNTSGSDILLAPVVFNLHMAKTDPGFYYDSNNYKYAGTVYPGQFADMMGHVPGVANGKTTGGMTIPSALSYIQFPIKYGETVDSSGDVQVQSITLRVNSRIFAEDVYAGLGYSADTSIFSMIDDHKNLVVLAGSERDGYTIKSSAVKINGEFIDSYIEFITKDIRDYNLRRYYYKIPDGETATLYYTKMTQKCSDKAAIFGIGADMMFYTGDGYDYRSVDRTFTMFNRINSTDDIMPAFILPGASADSGESSYAVMKDTLDTSGNVINIGEEIDISTEGSPESTSYLVIRRSDCEVVSFPKTLDSGIVDDDKKYFTDVFNDGAEGLCLTEDNLIVDLYCDGAGSPGKYKYVSDEYSDADWMDIQIYE